MTYRYHGNWCGPGWSDGEYVSSRRGFAPAVDEFDETCRQHDFAMFDAGGYDPVADVTFFLQNAGKGFKRDTAAWAVAARLAKDKFFGSALASMATTARNDKKEFLDFITQNPTCGVQKQNKETFMSYISAELEQQPPTTNSIINANKTNHLGFQGHQKMVKVVKKTKPMPKRVKVLKSQARTVAAPVSIGTQISVRQPKVTRSSTGATIAGTDFIGTVEGQGVSTFGLGKSALLSPAYFSSAHIGSLCRSFERYKWRKLIVHYIPKVATSTGGQVILCSQHNCTQPCLSGESGTFLARAMSQNNAVFTPVWQRAAIEIDCARKEWCLVDPTTNNDLDDNIYEELQVYTQLSSSQQPGFLVAEYVCEFKDPIYQPHSTSLPLPTGPGLRATFVDVAAANSIGDDWTLSCTTPLTLSQINNGTIYRAVFDLQGSTAASPATFNNQLNANYQYRTALAATTNTSIGVPLVGGLTVYLKVVGSAVQVYATIEDAVSGGTQMFFRTASTSAGTYLFDLQQVRVDPLTITSVQ